MRQLAWDIRTKLLGITKNKVTKDKNGKNVPHLEITEVVLIQNW